MTCSLQMCLCRREGGMPFGLDAMKRLLMQTAPPPVLS
jgi:hypothetical protein